MTRAVLWLRRDLRLGDHPALQQALANADEVVPLVVLDPRLLEPLRAPTRRYLASVAALRDQLGDALVVRVGRFGEVLDTVLAETGATSVHVSGETTPYGRRRDEQVTRRLAERGVELVATGTPYAVSPGRLHGKNGRPFLVFTPFYRSWLEHGWRRPPEPPTNPRWLRGFASDWGPYADVAAAACSDFPEAGEAGAHRHWQAFLDDHLRDYNLMRDRPDLPASSKASIPLKYGELHPRTMLADVAAHRDGRSAGGAAFVRQLCWREFYADVLFHRPDSDWLDLTTALEAMPYVDETEAASLIEAWKQGRTGYPLVDAGLRQLLAEGWMHNRVRMVCASFLAKDLHVWWPLGARHYMEHLIDADLSSNAHGWQWVAGTGTDGAPYFRVFNPTSQAVGFDPDGDFVRRYVPELRHIAGPAVHEPWNLLDGYLHGYPERIVDHDTERRLALSRYHALREG